MIPKIIHYCWFGKKKYPKLVKECILTWGKYFPDYEFILWNENNAPMDIPFVQEAYKNKKWAFVSDYIRLWAIYNHGGIYLDTDMYFVKTFDESIIKNKIFFGYEEPNNIFISAGIIGCERGNSFIGEIIKKYKTMTFSLKNISNVKIPLIITETYKKYGSQKDITLFPFDYFYPFPYSKRNEKVDFKHYISPNTYAIHLWNVSWKSTFEKHIEWIKEKIKKLL